MKGARQGEGALSDAIREALAYEPDLLLMRNSQAAMRKGSRVYRGGLGNGSADLVGVLSLPMTGPSLGPTGPVRFGLFVAIEVKMPGKSPEPHQVAWADSVRMRGGFACTVHSVAAARAAINRARRGERE